MTFIRGKRQLPPPMAWLILALLARALPLSPPAQAW